MPRLFPSLLLSLGIASSASAVTMTWTPIGNPGNACDLQSQGCFGAVSYAYNISTYEVTNAQYAEFLDAKAASEPLGPYNTSMGSSAEPNWEESCEVERPGATARPPFLDASTCPVNHVSFYDTMRFANWLNNGQGNGDTETGAYSLLGGTATPSDGLTATRNAGATIFLPSEDEWYKAAYYDALATTYYDYPIGTDAQFGCVAPTPEFRELRRRTYW